MLGEEKLVNPVALLQHLYPEQENWKSLLFGVFGGIDIGCTCAVLRNQPVRLSVSSERTSLKQFCSYVHLSFHELSNNINIVNKFLYLKRRNFTPILKKDVSIFDLMLCFCILY